MSMHRTNNFSLLWPVIFARNNRNAHFNEGKKSELEEHWEKIQRPLKQFIICYSDNCILYKIYKSSYAYISGRKLVFQGIICEFVSNVI